MGSGDYDFEEKGGAVDGFPAADGYREDESMTSQPPPKQYKGVAGRFERGMDFLVEHGVEERGIQPLPETVSMLSGPHISLVLTGFARNPKPSLTRF